MTTVISGAGPATALPDLLDNYRRLIEALPSLIEQHPNAWVVRARNVNLAIVQGRADGGVDQIGFIDVRTAEVEMYDGPWPIERGGI